MTKVRIVIIASKNPVKVNATKIGFEKMFPDEDFEFIGESISSNVSDQPKTNEETKLGAINRVNNATSSFPNADFWVGIEGGVEEIEKEMECFAWIVIKSKENDSVIGKSKTSTFFLPNKIVELINNGTELGEANDIIFKKTNSKQNNGSVGILTEDNITRTKYYVESIILALIPFKNSDIY